MAITLEELRAAQEYQAMLTNLTATQQRCTDLLDENRAMKLAAQSLCDPTEWRLAVEKALRSLRGPGKK